MTDLRSWAWPTAWRNGWTGPPTTFSTKIYSQCAEETAIAAKPEDWRWMQRRRTELERIMSEDWFITHRGEVTLLYIVLNFLEERTKQCSTTVNWSILQLLLEPSKHPSISRSEVTATINAFALEIQLKIDAKAQYAKDIEVNYSTLPWTTLSYRQASATCTKNFKLTASGRALRKRRRSN